MHVLKKSIICHRSSKKRKCRKLYRNIQHTAKKISSAGGEKIREKSFQMTSHKDVICGKKKSCCSFNLCTLLFFIVDILQATEQWSLVMLFFNKSHLRNKFRDPLSNVLCIEILQNHCVNVFFSNFKWASASFCLYSTYSLSQVNWK